MSQSDITAPILSYDDTNKGAEDFLKEHKRNEILPVDIEGIAGFDLGLNIFPFPNLQETFDVEGFISGDLNVIYVDEFIIEVVSFRLTTYYKALVDLPAVSCLATLSDILKPAFYVGRGEGEVPRAASSLSYRESGLWVRFLLAAIRIP